MQYIFYFNLLIFITNSLGLTYLADKFILTDDATPLIKIKEKLIFIFLCWIFSLSILVSTYIFK